jgi:hypothetical protein
MKPVKMGQRCSTGWFGRPSTSEHGARSTKVHAVVDGRVLCGYRPHHTMIYQWCSASINFRYLECPRCKEKAGVKRLRQLEAEKKAIEEEIARLSPRRPRRLRLRRKASS